MIRCVAAAGGAIAAGLIACAVGPAAADEIVTLETRPGVTQRFALLAPEKPSAAVILFSGGNGKVPLDKLSPTMFVNRGNFLVRTRYEFERHGLMVAVVDAPSDHQDAAGMLGRFRDSNEHATDVQAVVAYLQKKAAVPVWLVGTSRGTESAAALAAKLGDRIAGVVLTSSVSVRNARGFSVFEFPLDTIRVPALVVAHKGDGCEVTPPSDAARIADALKASKRKKVLMFEGGDPPKSDPCEALAAHGYLGIERKVVAAIAEFVSGR